MLALAPLYTRVLFSLPHPLVEIWIVWMFFAIYYLNYLFGKRDHSHQLSKTGELMNFREVFAVGCVGGFLLLTFITAFCTYLVMEAKDLL